MRQRPLFPRWSNSLVATLVVAVVVLLVGLPVLLMVFQRTPLVTGRARPVAQPIAFDHRHHVGDDGIDCRYCHDLFVRAPTAGMPTTARCLGCHAQIWNESPLLDALWQSRTEGRPIAWVRVHRLPDFVYFDHSAHVNHGVGCVSCHGRVDRMARIEQFAPLSMGWCLDCHRNPAPRLRPQSRITDLVWRPPPGQERGLASALMLAYDVRSLTRCTTCHR
ncbi:MAG: cytochrome c3 family protein [Myxococcota bacterium]